MSSLLESYKKKAPSIVFEWSDSETDAKGWVVINSLRGGAAGGGTRMRLGLDRSEVESLAKVMEIKFSVSGPAIGGGKSGINFDPTDPRKDEVIKRWFRAVTPLLKHYYGTGGDLNIDEVKDVIPITEDMGIWHPQEGVVNGHFQARDAKKINLIGQLRLGVSKIVEDSNFLPDANLKYNVADLITGYGVAESVIHYYKIYKGTSIEGKKVSIQGWGNVAGPAAYYLSKAGAKVVAILDKETGIIEANGLEHEIVTQLLINRNGNKLSSDKMIPFQEANERFWDIETDIFIPGAASKLVTRNQVERMLQNGLESISAGANVPFKDDDIFFGKTAAFVDKNCSLIPDFIANCGMARTFAYLMQEDVEVSDEAIFYDVSNTIKNALIELSLDKKGDKNMAARALDIALTKIMKTD